MVDDVRPRRVKLGSHSDGRNDTNRAGMTMTASNWRLPPIAITVTPLLRFAFSSLPRAILVSELKRYKLQNKTISSAHSSIERLGGGEREAGPMGGFGWLNGNVPHRVVRRRRLMMRVRQSRCTGKGAFFGFCCCFVFTSVCLCPCPFWRAW